MDHTKPTHLLVFPLRLAAISQHPVNFNEHPKQLLVVGEASEVDQAMVDQRSYPAHHQSDLSHERMLVNIALDAVHVGDYAETKQPDKNKTGGIESHGPDHFALRI